MLKRYLICFSLFLAVLPQLVSFESYASLAEDYCLCSHHTQNHTSAFKQYDLKGELVSNKPQTLPDLFAVISFKTVLKKRYLIRRFASTFQSLLVFLLEQLPRSQGPPF